MIEEEISVIKEHQSELDKLKHTHETEIKKIRRSEKLSVFVAKNPDSIYIPFGVSYFEDIFYAAKGKKAKIIPKKIPT